MEYKFVEHLVLTLEMYEAKSLLDDLPMATQTRPGSASCTLVRILDSWIDRVNKESNEQ